VGLSEIVDTTIIVAVGKMYSVGSVVQKTQKRLKLQAAFNGVQAVLRF